MNLVRMLTIGISKNFKGNNFNEYESIWLNTDSAYHIIFGTSLLIQLQK